jgi:hypothetical protein
MFSNKQEIHNSSKQAMLITSLEVNFQLDSSMNWRYEIGSNLKFKKV